MRQPALMFLKYDLIVVFVIVLIYGILRIIEFCHNNTTI